MKILSLLIFWIAWAMSPGSAVAAEESSVIDSLAEELRNRKTVQQAIDTITASDEALKSVWLEAILAGRLYVRKTDSKVVIVEKLDSGFSIVSAADETSLGTVGKREVSK
jgi:hypothetical protein